MKLYDDKAWLAELFDGGNYVEMAAEAGCSVSTIRRRLREHGIVDDGVTLNLSVFDACMLAKGRLRGNPPRLTLSTFPADHMRDAHWRVDWAASNVGIPIHQRRRGEYSSYFQTSSTLKLAPHVTRWYDEKGNKKIPDDMGMDMDWFEAWTMLCGRPYNYGFAYYAYDMCSMDVHYLADFLDDFGMEVEVLPINRAKGNTIYIRGEDIICIYEYLPRQIKNLFTREIPHERLD